MIRQLFIFFFIRMFHNAADIRINIILLQLFKLNQRTTLFPKASDRAGRTGKMPPDRSLSDTQDFSPRRCAYLVNDTISFVDKSYNYRVSVFTAITITLSLKTLRWEWGPAKNRRYISLSHSIKKQKRNNFFFIDLNISVCHLFFEYD